MTTTTIGSGDSSPVGDAVAERARDLRADYARLDTGEEFSEAFAAVWVG